MELLEVREIALELMEKHGLITKGWNFKLDNAKRRCGQCSYTNRTISVSQHYAHLNDIKHIRNTILHEIAHALTPKHHHDHVWRQKAIEIGCTGTRCASSEIKKVPRNYVAECNNGHKSFRFRKSNIKMSCGRCSNKFDPNNLLEWKPIINLAA